MRRIYVFDTTVIIEYFSEIFNDFNLNHNVNCSLSEKTKLLIEDVLINRDTNFLISIPSVCFIEIFEKWLRSEEDNKRFFYEIYTKIKENQNFEIREIDKEVLENFVKIGNESVREHDKIILATAMTLDAVLISKDSEIIDCVSKNGFIKKIIW